MYLSKPGVPMSGGEGLAATGLALSVGHQALAGLILLFAGMALVTVISIARHRRSIS